MKKSIIFILILISCGNIGTDKKFKGEYYITKAYNKDLDGAVELHFLPLYYDSTIGAGVEVLVDEKFIIFPNKNGIIRINLKKKSCISLYVFSLNSLVFSKENLCFDSNKVIHANLMLEWQ